MSLAFFKSLQTIDYANQSSEQIKSEMNIVNSYLSTEQWEEKKTFIEVLSQKRNAAKYIKERLMKLHGMKDHSEVVGFRCRVQGCNQIYSLPTALGGHMSKTHPNYKKQRLQKMKRQERIRQSSIEKIKIEHQHQQSTVIHSFCEQIDCQN